MAIYKTGRTRTLTMQGAISGSIYRDFEIPAGLVAWGISSFDAAGLHCSASAVSTVSAFSWSYELQVLAGDGDISPVGDTQNASGSWSSVGVFTEDISGSYSFSLDVEEFVEIETTGTFPSYGGASVTDPPKTTSVRFFELPKVGGTISATATAHSLGLTAYASKTITSTDAEMATISYTGSLSVTSKSVGIAQTTGLTGLITGLPMGILYTATNADCSATTDGGALVISGGTVTDIPCTCSLQQAPDKSARLNLAIRAMQSAYPSTIGVELESIGGASPAPVNAISGSVVQTVTQQYYSCGAYLNGVTYTGPSANEFEPVRCWLRPGSSGDGDPYSLLALGEDQTAWRILFRGFKWDAMTMTQADTMNVDNAPQTSHWTAGTNTTLANSGGSAITATVGSVVTGSLSSTLPIADGALKHSDWLGVSFCGYRFLRVELTGDDDDTDQPASIQLGSKQWDIHVGTSGYVDIDLCCPTNRTSGTDTDDCQWTWNGPSPYSVTDGEMWGVSNVSTFTIKNLAPGHVYTLNGLHLVRKDHAGITFLPTFAGWKQAFPSVTVGSVESTTYYRRARQADTDGRQSREDTDFVWIHTDDGEGITTDTYTDVPISAVVSALHTGGAPPRDGWDATDLMPNPNIAAPGTCTGVSTDMLRNCYLNSDLGSIYLYGSGAIFDGKRWIYGYDIGCTGTVTIPAQLLIDSVDWYPDCGDAWGWRDSSYVGDFQLAGAAILRGQAYGLIFNEDGDAVEGVKVAVTDAATGLVDAGSGRSGAVGEYKTGSPFGKGLVSYKVTEESGTMPYPSLTGTFLTRHRSRFCFTGLHVPCCCDILFCPDYFLFPFQPFMGDHTLLPLDDWRQIPDVADSQPEEDKEGAAR